MLLWLMNLGFAGGGTVVATPEPASTGAGRISSRVIGPEYVFKRKRRVRLVDIEKERKKFLESISLDKKLIESRETAQKARETLTLLKSLSDQQRDSLEAQRSILRKIEIKRKRDQLLEDEAIVLLLLASE